MIADESGDPICVASISPLFVHLLDNVTHCGFILDLASKSERQHSHTPWKRLPPLAAFSEWSADHYWSLQSSSTGVCQASLQASPLGGCDGKEAPRTRKYLRSDRFYHATPTCPSHHLSHPDVLAKTAWKKPWTALSARE